MLGCRLAREAAKFLSTLAAQEAFLPEIRQRRDMDDDHRELVRCLFATASELIETAHEAAIAGQSSEKAAETTAAVARRLHATARDVAILAEAAMIVANLENNGSRVQSNRVL